MRRAGHRSDPAYIMRMPRVQIYLPDDLYEAVKSRGMPISELSQDAVRAALHRESLRAETQAYLAELADRLGGPPSDPELAAADRHLDRHLDRPSRPASRARRPRAS